MSLRLILEVVLIVIIFILIIFNLLKKEKIPVKYSLIWLFSILIMLIAVLIPNFMMSISDLFGFATISSMLYALMIIILLFITIALTIIVSGQKEKIRLLIQETSILKEKVEKIETKKDNN